MSDLIPNNSNFPDAQAPVVAPQPLSQITRFKPWHLVAAIMVFTGAGLGVRQFSRASSEPMQLNFVEGEQLQLGVANAEATPHSVIDAKASEQRAVLLLQPASARSITATDSAIPALGDKHLTKLIVIARTNSCAGTQTTLQIGVHTTAGDVLSTAASLSSAYQSIPFVVPAPISVVENPHLRLIAAFNEQSPDACRSSLLIDKVTYFGTK